MKAKPEKEKKLKFKIPVPPAYKASDLKEALEGDTKVLTQNANVFTILKDMLYSNIHKFPKRLKDLRIIIPIFIVLWAYLGWTQAGGLTPILIFLTASYNNFIGKFFYLLAIFDVVIPFIRSVKSNKTNGFINIYKEALKKIKHSYKMLKINAIQVLLISSGIAIAFSNLITRNNKPDKYLVCVLFALFLIKSLGQKFKNRFFLLGQALIRDILKLINKKDTHFDSFVNLSFGGFSLGLILSFFVPYFGATNYSDPKGYIIGTIVFAGGVLFYIINKLSKAKEKHD